jgi:predicted metal-dependent hydrolase
VTRSHQPRKAASQAASASREADLRLGRALTNAGDFFAAHEAFEAAWRSAEPEERDFYQGLVHVVVAWYQAGRGNRNGCERQLAKATRRLALFAPAQGGVDVASVLVQVTAAARIVESGSLELPELRL